MDILFRGQSIFSNEWIESDSILQGIRPSGKYVFLKYRESEDQFSKWTQCKYETVKQIK